MHPFGSTRTRIARRHALIAPDGHMDDAVPGWHGGRTSVLIAPRLGAGNGPDFVLLLVTLGNGGGAAEPGPGVLRFVYMLEGGATVRFGDSERRLTRGGFALLPACVASSLRAEGPARLAVFERRVAYGGPPLFGDAAEVPDARFLDLDGVRTRSLVARGDLDLSMTLMRYRPGAALPMVETHEGEHGLLLLSGGGIARMEDSWYPVAEGDAIWMGPFCPQWFAAIGDRDAIYLLYKDGRRGPATARGPERHT